MSNGEGDTVTVNELIQKLESFDGELRVVTRGFDESDFEDIEKACPIKMQFDDAAPKFHGGRHKASAEDGVPAVFIDRE